jgi:predicted XRE-type DNA-binding protein
MAIDMKKFELDRLINMLKAFGWEMESSRIEGDKVSVSLVKVIAAEVPK